MTATRTRPPVFPRRVDPFVKEMQRLGRKVRAEMNFANPIVGTNVLSTVQSAGAVDTLVNLQNQVIAAKTGVHAGGTAFTFTAARSYANIVIQVAGDTSTKDRGLLATVTDNTTGLTTLCGGAAGNFLPEAFTAFGLLPGVTLPAAWVIPFANTPGDSITVTLYTLDGAGSYTAPQVLVLGLVSPIAVSTWPSPSRRDNRFPPLGSSSALFDFSSARTIVAAPAAPQRIFVHSVVPQSEYSTVGPYGGALESNVGGVLCTLCSQSAAVANLCGPQATYVPENGLLLDVGAALVTATPGGVTTNGLAGSVYYDVVD